MIQQGSKVLMKAEYPSANCSSEMLKWKANNIYGVVESRVTPTPSEFTSVSICFCEGIHGIGNISLYCKDLVEVKDSELEKYERTLKEFIEKNYSKQKKERQLYFTIPTGNYQDKDFTFTQPELSLSNVFVKQGKVDDKFEIGAGFKSLYRQGCCDFIKVDEGFFYYIPQAYLNFHNYTLWDVQEWLKFIEGCEFEFNYKLTGLVQTPIELLQKYWANNPEIYKNKDYKFNSRVLEPLENHLCVEIRVKQGECGWHNYLHLLLIRYLHHYYYSRIPMLAMQIKDALEDKVTNFQALLMAHLYKYPSGANGLVQEMKCVDIFQKPEEILQNLQKEGMNKSCKYLPDNQYSLTTCASYIEKLEFEELLTYLKKAHGL